MMKNKKSLHPTFCRCCASHDHNGYECLDTDDRAQATERQIFDLDRAKQIPGVSTLTFPINFLNHNKE